MKQYFQFRTFLRSKSSITPLLPICCILIFGCTSNSKKNRPSPLRYDSATVRGVPVYIEFSSPGVKNRTIFGEGGNFLVPFNELWRTGANNATFISIASDLAVDTFKLDSGSYSIFTIPNKNEWVVIFNREWDQWGSYNYKDSLDVFRINTKARYADQTQERLLFYFADDSLKFRWDKIRWALPINHP